VRICKKMDRRLRVRRSAARPCAEEIHDHALDDAANPTAAGIPYAILTLREGG
jgi:hypothetical protein